MVKIPRFRTEEEMREFWDTHDLSKYFEDMEDDEVQVTFKKIKIGWNYLRVLLCSGIMKRTPIRTIYEQGDKTSLNVI
jgi:hypothetical protein